MMKQYTKVSIEDKTGGDSHSCPQAGSGKDGRETRNNKTRRKERIPAPDRDREPDRAVRDEAFHGHFTGEQTLRLGQAPAKPSRKGPEGRTRDPLWEHFSTYFVIENLWSQFLSKCD